LAKCLHRPNIVSNQASFWSPNDECGLNGTQCEPFSDSSYAFRCGARPIIQLLNPRVVGSQELNYRPLLVGGGDATRTYRADTWFCAAAVQQKLVSTFWGGCAVARQTGGFSEYVGFKQNDIESVSFDSYFQGSEMADIGFSSLHAVSILSSFLAYSSILLLGRMLFWILADRTDERSSYVFFACSLVEKMLIWV